MKNNKGFAISIMLYAMVLLIVTIFYIILAIVKNRYTSSTSLVEQAVQYMTDNDDYALSGDKTPPIIVVSDNNEVYQQQREIKIYIYDDDDGAGLNLSTFKISQSENGSNIANSSSVNCNKDSRKISCRYTIPNSSAVQKLYISIKDAAGNEAKAIRSYVITGNGPTCTVTVTSDDASSFQQSGGTYSTLGGATIFYTVNCTAINSHGLNTFIIKSDFNVSNGSIDEIKSEYGIDTVKTVISVRADAVTNKDMTLSFKDGYGFKDVAGNSSNVTFPKVHIRDVGA